MDKTQSVSIRINSKHLEYLKKMSHYVSIERNLDLNYVDLIREAIEQVYPMPTEETPDEDKENSS
jgi:predicted DNA binding CopG/RHH family protein